MDATSNNLLCDESLTTLYSPIISEEREGYDTSLIEHLLNDLSPEETLDFSFTEEKPAEAAVAKVTNNVTLPVPTVSTSVPVNVMLPVPTPVIVTGFPSTPKVEVEVEEVKPYSKFLRKSPFPTIPRTEVVKQKKDKIKSYKEKVKKLRASYFELYKRFQEMKQDDIARDAFMKGLLQKAVYGNPEQTECNVCKKSKSLMESDRKKNPYRFYYGVTTCCIKLVCMDCFSNSLIKNKFGIPQCPFCLDTNTKVYKIPFYLNKKVY